MELTAAEAWSRILESARAQLPEQSYQTWLASTMAVGLSNEVLAIGAASAFAVEWIEAKYGELLTGLARNLFGNGFELSFESKTNGSEQATSFAQMPLSELEETEPREATTEASGVAKCLVGTLNPRYTLGQFVVARNNDMAAAACQAAAAHPGRAYNPLFIHGGVGLGKTHLMHAVGHAALERSPNLRVAYVSCEQFMNELIEAIQQRRTGQFHHRYRRIDVLLVDDVHFLADKEATQEEFFHTFNALHDAQKQIVLTSDRPPSSISRLQERLVSRFEWGLVTDIKPPDFETRLAILRLKAEQDGLTIGDDILSLVASRCRSSVRALEGALIKLLAYSSLTRRDLTTELAEEVLGPSFHVGKEVTAEHIGATVAEHFGVPMQALRSKSRARAVALPRQISMYLIRAMLHLPYTQIGRLHGGRDHSTVIHAIRRVDQLAAGDSGFRDQLQQLRSTLDRGRRHT